MPGMRVGFSMGVNGDDPRAFANLARDLGFREIVVNHQFREDPDGMRSWNAIFQEAGLSVYSWQIPHLSDAMLLDTGEREGGILRINRALSNLAGLGIRTAHTFAMLKRGDTAREAAQRHASLVETLRTACRSASGLGIRIACHFGWTPDLLVWNTRTALELLEDAGEPNCGVLLCPGSYLSAGDDARESARSLAARTFLVHARDARMGSTACENLHLGEGDVRYMEILAALIGGGCDALVVPEHLGPAHGQQREEIAQAQAAGYLRGILEVLRSHRV